MGDWEALRKTEDRDPVGTLYVQQSTGDAYRLRDYRPDWDALDDRTKDRSSYSVSYATRGHSTTEVLPEDAEKVWTPPMDTYCSWCLCGPRGDRMVITQSGRHYHRALLRPDARRHPVRKTFLGECFKNP